MRKQLNGVTLAYEDSGQITTSYPTILFIHGYPLNRKLWEPQMRGLGNSARLVVPDLRGFGDSNAPPGIYSMELLAEDCITLLDRLGIMKPVIVCGLSMGGYIAFAMYKKYPQRIRGLILASTRAGADSFEAKASRDKAVILVKKEGVEAIARLMLPKMLAPGTYATHPELVEQVRNILINASVPGVTGVLKGMRDRSDSTSLLAQIAVPTLLIFGEDDQFVPRFEIESMYDIIHGAQLHLVPDAGHLLNLEQPEIFNSLVRTFLSSFTGNL